MLGQDPGKDLRRDTSRIQSFLHECRTLGSLRGFKYFEVFMRGREELVLLIPKSHDYKQETSTLMPADVYAQRTMHDQQQPQPQQEQSPISSSGSSSQGSLMLAERVPINPKDQELKKLRSNNTTVLLITGYARYKCPYIYNRSSDDLYPMTLDTTETWRRKDVPLWEMVKEIFAIVTGEHIPCPPNPFKLDYSYLDTLPLEESVLLTGALLNFLQNIWIQADPSKDFVDAVYEDIKALQTRHLNVMYEHTARNIISLEQQVAN